MCGITGIFAYHTAAAPVNRDELRTMRDHMAARGPDGFGEWYSENNRVGLGHRRLSIIDLSERAAQPMASADGQLVISFNGEIYNYRELRRDLEARGRVFRTESDTEVLLHLYAEKGEVMLQDLRGMYAFAIWDAREQAVFLARDPFGIKPLYYANDGKTLRFASQVKALLAGGQIDTAPEPAGHAGFLLWGSVPEPWTLYRGIRSLPAGHFMWVSERGAGQVTPFCQISDILSAAAACPAQGSRDEALEVFAAAFKDSMAAHQVADVPMGVFLSAGLDSAMIAAQSSGAGVRLKTLTLAFAEFSGTANDEAPMAERLAAQFGSRHATLMVRQADFAEDRDKLFAAMDQPSIDGVNTWFVARAAASQGIKVALSGLGGDELLASYPSFNELPRIVRLAKPFARVPGLGLGMRKFSAPLIARHTSPKYASLLEYGGTLGGAYLLRRGLYMPWELPNVLDSDMAQQGLADLQTLQRLNATASRVNNASPTGGGGWEGETGIPARQKPPHPSPPHQWGGGIRVAPHQWGGGIRVASHQWGGGKNHNSRLAISALEMSCYMRNQLLRDTDWASMAHSLEVRVPFLDIPLLKTVAPWLAAHPGIRKAQIAAAVAPNLPGELFNKPKTGFSIPVRDWLMRGEDQPQQPERGLRGWARRVRGKFSGGGAA